MSVFRGRHRYRRAERLDPDPDIVPDFDGVLDAEVSTLRLELSSGVQCSGVTLPFPVPAAKAFRRICGGGLGIGLAGTGDRC